jgi:sugar lactone lactonase YvrE
MHPSVTCLVEAGCMLGEGPVWDERTGQLYWVDIKGPAIHRFDPATGEQRRWPAPEAVSALAVRERGGLVCALKSGFAFFDPQAGAFENLGDPQPDQPGNRLNDGKCDRLGRFWVGGMDDAEKRPSGDLFRLDPDLSWRRIPIGFVVTNGVGWSADGHTFYFNDSANRRAYAYGFDMAAGELGERRLFATLDEAEGHPDGLCVDAEDHVWIAHWDGGRVSRRRPDGSIATVISLPASRTTSCCFGGPDLDVLMVTSARIGLGPDALAREPLSGSVFAVTGLGVRGRPMNRFKG